MGIRNNKKVKYLCCLSIVLVVVITFGIYKYTTYQAYLTKPKEANINTVATSNISDTVTAIASSNSISIQKDIGNANYFNKKNGKYYADSKYTIISNDNTEYLSSLFKSEKSVNLPAGNFLCKTKIVLKGRDLSVTGVEGKTKIIFDSKTYVDSGVGAFTECLIINKNYAEEYKPQSAQSINISNITFEYKRYFSSSPKTIMLFKNIKAANLKNCSFIADLPNGLPVTNLDLYNGCKNVIVSNCNFINKTKATSGGCIWVRNLTTQTKDKEGNTTENINISKCSFDKDSKDEVIAVYSVVGDVKNVIINNCDIKDYFSKQDIVVMVYSSEDKYYGTVDNVIISNNNIYSQSLNSFIISTGVENSIKPTTNVIITNNKIITDSQNDRRKIIIYNAASNKDSNILVNNNEITTDSPCFAAIVNASCAERNKITGRFENGIVGGVVINNIITGAVNGIVNVNISLKNTISKVDYGIRIYKGDCYINGNTVVLNKPYTNSVKCGIEILAKDNVDCSKNTIQTYNKSQYGIIAEGANTTLNNNKVLGEGLNIIKNN